MGHPPRLAASSHTIDCDTSALNRHRFGWFSPTFFSPNLLSRDQAINPVYSARLSGHCPDAVNHQNRQRQQSRRRKPDRHLQPARPRSACHARSDGLGGPRTRGHQGVFPFSKLAPWHNLSKRGLSHDDLSSSALVSACNDFLTIRGVSFTS
jgi:hypothetical protein